MESQKLGEVVGNKCIGMNNKTILVHEGRIAQDCAGGAKQLFLMDQIYFGSALICADEVLNLMSQIVSIYQKLLDAQGC